MRNKTIFFFFLTITFLYSCTGKSIKQQSEIKQVISKLKMLNISAVYEHGVYDSDSCYKITDEDILIKNLPDFNGHRPSSILGILPDTADNYKIVFLYVGDEVYPLLRIFDKKGKMIAEESDIAYHHCADIGGWGIDENGNQKFTVDTCDASMKILNGKTIEKYLRIVTTNLDSLGNEITGNEEIHSQKISVDNNGKIIVDKERITHYKSNT